MVARADILAGRAVILVNIQDTVEAQLRGIRSKLRMFTNSFSDLGSNLFRGGAVGSFASYFPVKEFVDFQDQLLFLQTKLQVTDQAMVPLEKRIRDLGMSTSFSSAEVAKAATMFAQAGFSITETSDALQAALDLARGGQIDISTSTTILANSIRTFGANANQAAEYASKFIAAARLGTLDLVDLGQSLTYSSGTFANLGVDIEYVLGLITNLSKSGLKASLAGTSLNTAFLNLAGSADKLQESLGIALLEEDFDNPILGLTKIQKALDKFPKLEQLSIVQDLVNIRGGRAIFGTFLQGLDSLQKTTDEIRNSADEARIASVKLDSRLGGVGRRALSAFQELNIAIGSTAEGPLTMLGESMAAFLNDLSQLSAKFPKFTQALLLAGPAALIAGAGLLSLTFITGKIAALITPVLMLNAAIFKLGAGLVGLNVGILKDSYRALNTEFYKNYKLALPVLKSSFTLQGIYGGISSIIATKLIPAYEKLDSLLIRLTTRQAKASVFSGFTPIPINKLFPAAQVQSASRGAGAASLLGGQAGGNLTPRGVLPVLNGAFQPKESQGLFDFEGIDKAAKESAQKTRIAAKLVAVRAKKEMEIALNATVKSSTGFRGLSSIIAEGVNVGIALVADPGYIKANPLIADRIGQAVSDVLSSNKYPAVIAPKIAEGIRKAFQIALPVIQNTSLPILNSAFDPVFKQLELGLQTDKLFDSSKIIGTGFRNTAAGFAPVQKQAFGGKGAFAARQAALEAAQEASIGKPGIVSSTMKSFMVTVKDIFRNMKPLLGVVGNLWKGFIGLGKSVAWGALASKGFDKAIHGTYVAFRSLWGVTKGVFSVLNGIRRVVFSFSGFLTILELLILFGDRIPGIKDVLAGAGAAISGLFSNIGKTLADTLPAFKVLGQGIKSIFTGDAENGVMKITMALKNMTAVVQTGLSMAWKQFVADIQPAIDLVHNLWIGISNVGAALIEVLSSNLGLVFKTGKILIGADGSLAATIAAAFSPENLQGFFASIIAIIGEIGKFINTIIGAVAEVLNLIKQGFIGILQLLTLVKGTDAAAGAQSALDAADLNSPARQALINRRIGVINNAELAQQGASPEQARLIGIQARFEANQIQQQIDALGPAFGTIAYTVEESNAAIDAAMSRFIANLNAMGSAVSDAVNPLGMGVQGPQTEGQARAGGWIGNTLDDFVSVLPKAGLETEMRIPTFEETEAAGKNIPTIRHNGEDWMDTDSLQYAEYDKLIRAYLSDTPIEFPKQATNDLSEFTKPREGGPAWQLEGQILDDFDKAFEDQNRERMGKTAEAFKSIDDMAPTMQELLDRANGKLPVSPEAIAPQQKQLQKYSDIVGKAIGGSFSSTRGNQLQAVSTTQRLQEKANKHLGEIATSTKSLLEKPGALWG